MAEDPKNLLTGQPLGEEVTDSSSETAFITEGQYNVVLGKVEKVHSDKTGKNPIRVDFFFLRRKLEDGKAEELIRYTNAGQEYHLELIKNAQGSPITYGISKPLFLQDPKEGSTKAVNFLQRQRRQFARVFNALDDQTGVINWKKIQESVGSILSVTLVKDDKYLNFDLNTMTNLGRKASLESLVEIYKTVAEMRDAYKDSKSAPAPSDVEDDIPF